MEAKEANKPVPIEFVTVATGSAVPGVGFIHKEAWIGLVVPTNFTTTNTVTPHGYSVGE